MTPHYTDPLVTLYLGDCLDVMPALGAESVDAVVTDPPYGLGFMGKHWDHGVPNVDFWREMYRVLKPGGYLLSFAGTRTVHRFGVVIEDAGFEIRDTLMWIYASGFPKSLDVSKAMDKAAGAEREVVGQSPNWRESKRNREAFGSMEVRGENAGLVTAPATDLARQWQGWGTNLKPAHEPIVMARKPLIGTVAANVTRYGTGAINVDGCRIGTTREVPASHSTTAPTIGATGFADRRVPSELDPNMGRWPSNVLLSDPELFDQPNPGVVGSGATTGPSDGLNDSREDQYGGYADAGGYSRFFVIPKSDRAERERGLEPLALRLHRERGECDKLSAWESQGQSRNDQTDSTSPARAISDEPAPAGETSSSDTSSPGKPPTARSPRATRSTTSTGTSRTTTSETSSSLTPLPTSESTPAASLWTASGGSPAQSASSSDPSNPSGGTSQRKAGPSTGGADPATSARWSSRNVCADCGKPLPRGSSHPTVKPIDLMRHLVRLVTPPGGTVLDPFLGSGTTALAASEEGFRCIGIERELEYLEIAKGRLMATPMGLGLDVPAPVQKRSPIKDGAIGGNGLGSHYDRLGNTKRGVDFRDEKFADDEEPAA